MNKKSSEAISFEYPETKHIEVSDHYFGTEIVDPYRWLEDDRSEETEDWVMRQNKFTHSYLDKIPFRDEIEKKLSAVWNYEKLSAPFKEGGVEYFYKNDGLQNQYVVYSKKEGEEAQVFLNPNTFSEDGTTSLGSLSFSKDGSLLAYSISEGGSDWRKVIVMDVASKEILEDTLVDIKFSGLSWKSNEGFFYSSYEKPKGSELSAKTDHHKLFYHVLGTDQGDDKLFYGSTADQKRRYVSGDVTEDDKYLMISAATSTSGNELYLIDLESDNGELVTVVDNFDSDTYLLDNNASMLYFVTNLEAPNKRVVSVDASNPQSSNWLDVIPESEHVLRPSTGGGFLFAHYMVDAISQVKQYDFYGKLVTEVSLPGIGTANGFRAKKEDKDIFYTFGNYNTPSSIYKYDPANGTTNMYWTPEIDFKSDNFVSSQVFYTSKDGTKIPMIITHKKGIELDGNNPTILYGYGGFNISLTPSFSITNSVWMDMGGIYAVPNLRGGGEYGKSWHIAGTKMNKQNVFDDFIAAAEYLIEKKYTDKKHLAISGRSNGGLLVGAVANQRPDLMKVALPGVGVLDMLRYHTFTAGAGWAYDYGTADESKEMFEYLAKYSPVHSVRDSIDFPAVLVTTGDHDDRVVPAHSFKYAAVLQDKQTGSNPTMIRIETEAGHGAGTPVSKTIKAKADELGFTLFNMGYKTLKEI
jgi:prolyl oligopeptidase